MPTLKVAVPVIVIVESTAAVLGSASTAIWIGSPAAPMVPNATIAVTARATPDMASPASTRG
jgi:hypothetical protein